MFEPAMKDGKPVAVQINVEVSFRLSEMNAALTAFVGVYKSKPTRMLIAGAPPDHVLYEVA